MLKDDVATVADDYISVSQMRAKVTELLDKSSSEEFLEMMFDAVRACRVIDSILDEYDSRRQQVLQEMAQAVPQDHKVFFIHAFSRRTPEDALD